MTTLRNIAFTFLIVIFIVGCGHAPKGTGPKFTYSVPGAGMAKVYHYRVEKLAGNGIYYYLFMNGDFVTIIGNGGYYIQDLLPGEYIYATTKQVTGVGIIAITYVTKEIDNKMASAKQALTLNVEPNKSYYLRWSYTLSGAAEVEQVEEPVALKEIEGLKRFEYKSNG